MRSERERERKYRVLAGKNRIELRRAKQVESEQNRWKKVNHDACPCGH